MVIGIDGNEANVENRVGSGVYTLELLKQFAKIKNCQFLVYLKQKPQTDLPPESETFKYQVFGPQKFWTQFALPIKLTFAAKPNVFFSPAHYGPRFSKVPYVVTIHDLSYLHFPELFRKEDLFQLTSWSKYSINKSKAIIAPSQSTKNDLVKNYKIDPAKITVTHEGYNKQSFKPQSSSKIAAVKKKYKVAGDYIIFVGTVQPRKNIERLIEAFSSVKNNASLVIVGKKGWLYESILGKSKALGIEKKVVFTGFVPDSELPALISGAKLYVNPSLWEGFGIPVIEAQACGVPVAVSNTSSLPEIVGDSGAFFDPEDTKSIATTVENLLKDEKTRLNLAKAGIENAKRYSWTECAKKTIEVLLKF